MIRNTCYKAYTRHSITPLPPLPTPALPPVTIFSHQDTTQLFLLGRTHEKQWIRRSESTSAKREWIWIYESTAFECVLRLNTPQTTRHFFMIGCLVVDIF